MTDRGGLVVRSLFRDRRVPGFKSDSTKDPPRMLVWWSINLSSWVKCLNAIVAWNLGERGACSDVALVSTPQFKIAISVPK
ncbi:hypothetical protein AVEN_13573-1 [Araneus ventricosus]|uniref:Uncharacterized protein n=1 Tax=Araneus ventricosus TaxID=182803 RepID=A0A4Y2D4X5_ARAVE|nr:hypothetical protein AVEN_13573-1 [Araneus ventricosus]